MGSPVALCDGCNARITFVTVTRLDGRRSRMPLNDHPDPAGNIAVRISGQSKIGRVRALGQALDTDETRYMPHFATCPNPPKRRKPGKPAPKPAPPPPATLFDT